MEGKKMVVVAGAHKKYGSTVVLNGLNMCVPRGTIYGLLGPSGCGKTTLLSCLVGRKHLDRGAIRLGVCKRKLIGYMPQDVALFLELDTEEIFQFYGKIFGLDNYTVEYRLVQLTSILELPPKQHILNTMSGGQQRRVSLAVTLLHNPDLIILDEPTVGLDPILAHNVWQYLLQLSNEENKTIIITTHYIEEAGQSHLIGLMREGTLLVEASPRYLMTSHNLSSLEEVFLNFCKKQQLPGFKPVRRMSTYVEQLEEERGSRTAILSEGTFKINRFWAQFIRNIRLTYRNKGMLLFILLLPLIESFLYATAFGKDPSGLSLGVVSEEHLDTCSLFPPNISHNTVLGCSVPTSLPCQFVTHLASKSNIIFFDSLVEAKSSVANRVIWGALHFNPNFTEAFIARMSNGISTDDIILDQGVISVWMDMSNYIISNQLRRYIMETLIDYIKHVLQICGINPEVGNIPILFNDPIYGEANTDHGFSTSGLPGFLSSFIFSLPLTFTAGAIMMDKTSGLLDRNAIAGLTRLEVVMAHLIVQIVVVVTQTGIMSFMLYMVYEHKVLGDVSLVMLIMSSIASVGISYGFFLAEIFSNEAPVNYTAIGSTLTLLLTSGIVWPMEGGHFLIKSWAKFIPVVATVESLSEVSIRGYNLYHPSVYFGLISSFSWTIIFGVLTYIFYKINSR